jgi:hypothetical protein
MLLRRKSSILNARFPLSASLKPLMGYAVIKKEGNEKGTWLEIGAAWPHRDGKGFGVKLNLIPFSGTAEIVICPISNRRCARSAFASGLRLSAFPKASQKRSSRPQVPSEGLDC